MKAKYIRVSAVDQNTERQETNSDKFQFVYIDKISGAIPFLERPQGKKLISYILNGKINEVHISSIDRMGRNILDILTVSEFLIKMVSTYMLRI
jgi:DNA invertase Pin-like site-specific DNA recombinase